MIRLVSEKGADMAESLVEYECRDQIAILTLNRPEKLNAFNDDLVRHLMEALRRFDLDHEAQVAIICGKGRAFSSGADVQQRQLRRPVALPVIAAAGADGVVAER
jgi:enoyl-CoA hydratase/carnithine racemase